MRGAARLVLRRLVVGLLECMLVLRSVRPRPRLAALTFDDGPRPTLTPALIAALRDCDVPATFFVLGALVQQHPDLVRMLVDAKMEIGSHGMHHISLRGRPAADQAAEIAEGARVIGAASGQRVNLFRAPYGEYDEDTFAALDITGQELVGWNVDPYEWTGIDVVATVARVVSGARTPAVILMHDASASTVAAIPGIVRAYRGAGYRFVTVSEISRAFPRARSLAQLSPKYP